jgi:hypothetical protein
VHSKVYEPKSIVTLSPERIQYKTEKLSKMKQQRVERQNLLYKLKFKPKRRYQDEGPDSYAYEESIVISA